MGVWVGVGVRVCVGVWVGVGVRVCVGVWVGVGVLVGVGGARTVVSSVAKLLSTSICSSTRLIGRSTRTVFEIVVAVAVQSVPVISTVTISP